MIPRIGTFAGSGLLLKTTLDFLGQTKVRNKSEGPGDFAARNDRTGYVGLGETAVISTVDMDSANVETQSSGR